MQDVKSLIYNELTSLLPTLSRVQSVKSFPTTERVILDAEKLVFKDAAIALGSSSFELELYSKALDKIRHRVQLLYFTKSTTALEESVSNINKIAASLRLNEFETTSLINGKLEINYEFIQLTDKINYAILEYSVVELQGR